MNIVQKLIATLLVLVLAGMVLAQQSGGAIIIGTGNLPTTLDSGDANDGNSIAVTSQITEKLITHAPGTTTLMPALAKSWTGNEDSTVWVFELEQGVRFHDGTPFNAEAVKFSLDRWNDPENPYRYSASGKAYPGWGALFGGFLGSGSALDRVTVLDEYTVQLELNRSVSFLPAILASGYFGFDSPTAVMAAGADYGTPKVGSVGTGPFEFGLWEEGTRIVLNANPDYRKGPPASAQLVFVGVGDATARIAQLKAGALDVVYGLAQGDLPSLESDPNVEIVRSSTGGLNTSMLSMHQSQPPFDDVRVRQAVSYAIDRQALVDAFDNGEVPAAKDILPPNLWGHADVEPYTYDPERARELLAEAGYPNGFDTELWYRETARFRLGMVEAMASYLAEVGIRASLKTEDAAAFLQDQLTGKFPLYTAGWNADFADPDTFIYTFYGPTSMQRFGWDAPDVVALTEQARKAPTQAERAVLYAEVMAIAHEAAPSLPLAHGTPFMAIRKGVQGVVINPLGGLPSMAGVSK
ncbi:MAG: ABC transporter substrate-binding protein [Trueperaceae bacterium]|nr:ABC transporter substrate-binding protein [Trueperaceae bacterium]